MIGRREFITLLGGAAAIWPLAAHAQQRERVRRVGMLTNLAADDPLATARVAAFAQAMQELGWTVGRNLQIDYRWGQNDPDRLRKYAAELVALAPEVIVANANPSTTALQQATRSVPVVFVNQVDPVGAGFVESLARPGGNITGFTNFEYGLGGKWLELLKEIAPRVMRVAVLRDPASASGTGQLGAIQSVAPSFGVELRPVDIRNTGEIERALAAFSRTSNGGMIVTGSRVRAFSSGRDPCARRPAWPACGLLIPPPRRARRADLLRARFVRPVPARGRLCGSHPQGRETRRPAGAGTDQVRAGHQPQDRQDARPRPCRRRCSPAPTR